MRIYFHNFLMLVGLLAIPDQGYAQLLFSQGVSVSLKNGAIATVKGDVTINSGASIVNEGMLRISGNMMNNSGGNCFGTSNGSVELFGINQQLGGTSVTVFNHLLISSSSTLTLQQDITCGGAYVSPAGVLQLGNAVLDLNAHTLQLNNTAPGAITTGAGYIRSEKADHSSKVKWMIGSTAGLHTIPFGNIAGNLTPFGFERINGNAEELTVSTYATNPANLPLPVSPIAVTSLNTIAGGNNSANVVDRFWDVHCSGNPVANMIFTFAPSELPSNPGVNLRAQRWDLLTNGWSLPSLLQGNPTPFSVQVNNVSDFGPWALAWYASPLPVSLLSFTVEENSSNGARCLWTTSSEINNDFFTLLRSSDGINFSAIARVEGAGNSSVLLDYVYVDDEPLEGVSYYQLMQTDFDGSARYSQPVPFHKKRRVDKFMSVFPNPTAGEVFIKASAGVVSVSVVDISGREVIGKSYEGDMLIINMSHFPAGTYFINIRDAYGKLLRSERLLKR